MSNRAFSKLWITIILIVLVAGGILAWQYFMPPEEEKPNEELSAPVKANLSFSNAPALNQEATLTFAVTLLEPGMEDLDSSIEVLLPEGFKLVSGSLSREEELSTGEDIQINAVIKSVKNGTWTIEGKGEIGKTIGPISVSDKLYVSVSNDVASISKQPPSKENDQKSALNNYYSFKSISEGDLSKQQYLDYSVEVYKDQQLIKKISIKDTFVKPNLFVLSPDQRYVAFKTAVYGGTCVYSASPNIIDLNNFSIVNLDDSDINKKLENVLGIDPADPKNKFSAVREIENISWVTNDKIEVTMKFGDKGGCSILVYPKPANFPEEIKMKVDYTIIK